MTSKYEKFNFLQHNIRSVMYYNDNIPEKTKYARIISSGDTSSYRDLEKYLKKGLFDSIDLFTLQEVQHSKINKKGDETIKHGGQKGGGKKKKGQGGPGGQGDKGGQGGQGDKGGNKGDKHYGYVYEKTEPNDFFVVDTNGGIGSNKETIEHGCMVVYNKDRFKLEDIDYLDNYPELKKRSSPLVHLKDKKSKENYLVLSLQGIDPFPLSYKRSDKIKKLYNSLIRLIDEFNSAFKKVVGVEGDFHFIIGTDMKFNIFESKKLFNTDSKIEAQEKIIKVTTKLIRAFGVYNIDYDFCDKINTIYQGERKKIYTDCVDFIFKSKYLYSYEIEYGCNYIGTYQFYGELRVLEQDFEHKAISCLLGID